MALYNSTNTGDILPKSRSGRPKKLTTLIERQLKFDPKISAPKLAAGVEKDHNIKLNPETVTVVL